VNDKGRYYSGVTTQLASVKDFLTTGCAVRGATLGIINTVIGLIKKLQ